MPYPAGLQPHEHGLPRLAQDALPVLYQHRLLTTRQLHRLLQPQANHAVYLRRQLSRLRERGLAAATVRHRGGQGELVWYCTPTGSEIVEAAGEVTPRAYRMTEAAAANQLQEHTLAVNDTGISFVEAARRYGHDCGPLDWHPERAHRFRDGTGDDAFLIPDAVLSYVHDTDGRRRMLTYFLEIDRATESPLKLAAKVRAYARYLDYIPLPPPGRRPAGRGTGEAWRERYPAFPRLLFVLTGAPAATLARRTADLRALADADPRLRRAADRLLAGIVTLEQLQDRGPWVPVITPVFGPGDPTDALLRTPQEGQSRL
ncbi:replication-relaxation family protein [Streptomyces sp. PTM05]|uniref:Replication-relaxation family protein n=1 Tax=Streptantibioticus parmotrematis TaxID=2873249 RepID=A0ABS7R191_9ACTN|nr:replication-relaxation family protein [Streptantibioticus parmotrematis]MBY8889228.1 replication-relaxation family protein [Streptantibioticus parmotrematis]